jgi:hypothetical protein
MLTGAHKITEKILDNNFATQPYLVPPPTLPVIRLRVIVVCVSIWRVCQHMAYLSTYGVFVNLRRGARPQISRGNLICSLHVEETDPIPFQKCCR